MKKITRFLTALTMCCSFGLSAVSCKKQPASTDSGDSSNQTQTGVIKRAAFNGIHETDYTFSANDYLLKDGKTEYKILIPESVDTYVLFAANELSRLFTEATNVPMEVVIESDAPLSGKYISIGDTNLYKSKNYVKDARLKGDGYTIKTGEDKNIYIQVKMRSGYYCAAYGFMELLFNYDYFGAGVYGIDRNVVEMKLPLFDVIDIPDFAVRSSLQGIHNSKEDTDILRKMRYSEDSTLMNIGDTENGQERKGYHNVMDVLPREADTSMEEWYGSGPSICYTAHGNQEAYEAMVERIAYVICELGLKEHPVSEYPSINSCTFSKEDGNDSCNCEYCAEKELAYGSKTGQVIVLLGDVMVKVREWMNKPENAAYKRDEFHLLFFAYTDMLGAPTCEFDEELGKYVLVNQDLKISEDVGVFLALNSQVSLSGIYHDSNIPNRATIEQWCDIMPYSYVWLYNTNISDYLTFWPSGEGYSQEGYNYFAALGMDKIQIQCEHMTEKLTAFGVLDAYLESKMLWNSSLSMVELKEKWFEGMFGGAADIMKQLYLREVFYTTELYEDENKKNGHGFGVIFNEMKWSISEVETWLDLLEKAYAMNAELYKDADPEKYAMVKRNINREFYSPATIALRSFSMETMGQTYKDIVKYLQANEDEFTDYIMGTSGTDSNTLWKDIVLED